MMKNFLKYSGLIVSFVHIPQDGIAKNGEVKTEVRGGLVANKGEDSPDLGKNKMSKSSLNEIFDANGNLISGPEGATNPALEDPLPQTLGDPKNSLFPGKNVDEAVPVVRGRVQSSSEKAMLEKDGNLDATGGTIPQAIAEALPPPPVLDETPLPPEGEETLPSPPVLDETPLPSGGEETLPPPVLDEVPPSSGLGEPSQPQGGGEVSSSPALDEALVPQAMDEKSHRSASEIAPPSLAVEDQSTASVEGGLIPPSAKLATPSNIIPSGEATVAPVDLSPQAEHERDHLQAEKQQIEKTAAQMQYQAEALRQAQQRQANQRLEKQEAAEFQKRERSLQNQVRYNAARLASKEKKASEQKRLNQQVLDEHGNHIHEDEIKGKENVEHNQLVGSEKSGTGRFESAKPKRVNSGDAQSKTTRKSTSEKSEIIESESKKSFEKVQESQNLKM